MLANVHAVLDATAMDGIVECVYEEDCIPVPVSLARRGFSLDACAGSFGSGSCSSSGMLHVTSMILRWRLRHQSALLGRADNRRHG